MLMPATTTVSISRPNVGDVDDYGDPIDTVALPISNGLPAIISYRTGTVKDPASGVPVQVDASEVVLDKGTDVRDQDVLTDEQTGERYTVVQVRTLPSYGLPADVWLSVKRINGSGT